MERDELIAQIEQFLLPELQPGYDRNDQLLRLNDEELYDAMHENCPPELRRTTLQGPELEKAIAMYRQVLLAEQTTRPEWRNKLARKLLVFVNRARARRASNGPLTMAEYIEAKLWRVRRDTERSRRYQNHYPNKTGDSAKLDEIQRTEIARTLEVLTILDTDTKLDEAAVRAIEDRLDSIRREAQRESLSLIDPPPPLRQLIERSRE